MTYFSLKIWVIDFFKTLCTITIILIVAIIINILLLKNNISPDEYTKDGYCVVNTSKQRTKGLLRFKTEEEFNKQCNGKMIFEFKEDACREFTMKGMKFNIFVEDSTGIYPFKIEENKFFCGKTITELSTRTIL